MKNVTALAKLLNSIKVWQNVWNTFYHMIVKNLGPYAHNCSLSSTVCMV
jgi:hypothetical protein